ncbi:CPBP family intramembrane glutamic endopeptidase [Microlunatus speluncae]|uniref:CPBP family intramembrane glutamic endopeptidase n=1 Tax=Microlunatus speluncae TaxID=2594267 RepID=UPI0012666D0B|nr:CPBP family intramembrane glutamic endopeptidase [Microlunatus speluncae]
MNEKRRQRSGNPAVRGGATEPPAKPAKPPRPVKAPKPAKPAPPQTARPSEPRSFGSSPRLAKRPAPVAGGFDDALSVPTAGLTYPQLLRVPGSAWWRALLGVALGLLLFMILTSVINQAIVFGFWAIGSPQTPYAEFVDAATKFLNPVGMLGANLGLATLIVICAVLLPIVHRVNPRWLISVESHVRWRYFGICLALGVVAPVLIQGLATVVEGAPVFRLNENFWLFLIVIILTSPLQAAAEEVFFRGYLLQALGSVTANPWFGIVVSSVIFALFHGVQNPALFVDRLAFGLLAAILVWRTGGLEAGIGAHIANNVLAYLLAGLTGTIAATRGIREIGWENAVFDVVGFALFAVLALLVARKLKIHRTTPPAP